MREIIITSSALIVCIVLIRSVFKGRISARLQYTLWLLVALRLIIPVSARLSLPFGELNAVRVMDLVQSLEDDFGSLTDRLTQPPHFAVNLDSPLGRQVATYFMGDDMPAVDLEDGATSIFLAGRIGFTWIDIMRGIWYGGMGIMAVCMAAVNFRFGRKLRRERRAFAIPEAVKERLCAPVAKTVSGHRVRIYTVGELSSPCLYGFPGREAVYLPEDVTQDEDRLRHVLTHEICHRRHGDAFWALLRSALLIVYWFHPLVWVAAALSKRDCELACDESAVVLLGENERIEYGKTLLSIISGKRKLSDFACTATTMVGTGKSIKERIRMIAERPKTLRAVAAVVLVLAVLACAFVFTRRPETVGDIWSGVAYVTAGDKRIMLPDSIAGISGYLGEEDGNTLTVYQTASNREVGRFCTLPYEEATALVDAGRSVVALGDYGMNIPLKEYMGWGHVYTPAAYEGEDEAIADNGTENLVPRRSEKEPFAFDGKTEWIEDGSNRSAKKPFAFDGATEWQSEQQPEQVTGGPSEGVPGTDSNAEMVYLPDEEIEETRIMPSYAGDCYIYVTADYSDLAEKYLEEMEYIDGELRAVCGQVIVTEINRSITEETFEALAEHKTMYLGDNTAVSALVTALPQPDGLLYDGIELKTGTNEEKRLRVCYRRTENTNSEISAEDIMFFNAVMLFATIENMDRCDFATEGEEITFTREEAARRTGVEVLWRELEGDELQSWLEELYQRVLIDLHETSNK